jgi:hypothetical protein
MQWERKGKTIDVQIVFSNFINISCPFCSSKQVFSKLGYRNHSTFLCSQGPVYISIFLCQAIALEKIGLSAKEFSLLFS